MGLDMYLKASRCLSGWNHSGEEQVKVFSDILEKIDLDISDVSDDSRTMNIDITVGYWRKSHAVHSWFVENVQGGHDECQSSYVTRDQLKELKTNCLEVLVDNRKANDLLPVYGDCTTGYTRESMVRELEHTVKIIDKCLSNKFKQFNFEYQASW